MSDQPKEKPFTRRLHDWEVEEIQPIFRNTLKYPEVEVHENTDLTNIIDDIGRMLKGMPARAVAHQNAIGFGNKAIFPIRLPARKGGGEEERELMMMSWLVHELTHVWQYQHMGWEYLLRALTAQIRHGANVYNYGGWEGLKSKRAQGYTLYDFNVEQQATIVQDYYTLRRRGENTASYQPYIDDISGVTTKKLRKGTHLGEPDDTPDENAPELPDRPAGGSAKRGG